MTTPLSPSTEINEPISPTEIEAVNIDSLIEELDLLHVEGLLFCFDKRAASRRPAGLYDYPLKDGSNVRIAVSAYGQPSVLAYKLMQVIFYLFTDESHPFPSRISFTRYGINKLLRDGRYGGKDGKEIVHALDQLRSTGIEITGKTHRFGASKKFSVIHDVVEIYDCDDLRDISTRAPVAYTIHLSDLLLESIRAGHFAIFNWNIVSGLEPLAAALYKRLYFNFCNLLEAAEKQNNTNPILSLRKDYSALCRDWLGGLTVHQYKSKAIQQLSPALLALKECGFLRSYSIDANAAGDGYNVTFRPGKQFFNDYVALFKKKMTPQLQFQHSANEAEYHQPTDLVLTFYEKLKGRKDERKRATMNELRLARQLLDVHGRAQAVALVEYALTEARRTKWDVQSFQAVARYESDFLAQREERQRAQTAEAARQSQIRLKALTSAYQDFVKDWVTELIDHLAPTERTALEKRAGERLGSTVESGSQFARMGLSIAMRAIVSEEYPAPSFEDWLAAKQAAQRTPDGAGEKDAQVIAGNEGSDSGE